MLMSVFIKGTCIRTHALYKKHSFASPGRPDGGEQEGKLLP